MIIRIASFLLLTLTFLTSCSYRLGQGSITDQYQTISVPYVCGDLDGTLTAELIKQLEITGGLHYVNCQGDIQLLVNLVDLRDQNIGFRYYREHGDKITRCLVPTETRVTAVVEVKVVDLCTGQCVLGPVILKENVVFDYEYLNGDGVNIFSLGQLNDDDAARITAKTPLNKALARKIVEYVNESW